MRTVDKSVSLFLLLAMAFFVTTPSVCAADAKVCSQEAMHSISQRRLELQVKKLGLENFPRDSAGITRAEHNLDGLTKQAAARQSERLPRGLNEELDSKLLRLQGEAKGGAQPTIGHASISSESTVRSTASGAQTRDLAGEHVQVQDATLSQSHKTPGVPNNQSANRWGNAPMVPDPGPADLPGYILGKESGGKGFVRHGIVFGPDEKFTATFNPTAWTAKDSVDGKEKVFMMIRGEEELPDAEWKRRSLPYLASSEDGIHFKLVQDAPVFTATEWYEKAGGVEDPRFFDMRLQPHVDPSDGKSFDGAILYTAFDGTTARVAIAYFNHDNPQIYRKGGLLFPPEDVRKNPIVEAKPEWNKSPAAIQYRDPKTGKIRNIIYVGEGSKDRHGGIMAMESDAPFGWKWPESAKPVIQTENGLYIQNLVEPAFQPLIANLSPELAAKTGQSRGIYVSLHGDSPPKGYQVGYQIFSLEDPTGPPIFRSTSPFLSPQEPYELEGQVDKVVFASGSVEFMGQRYIYYGAADKVIGAISAEAPKTERAAIAAPHTSDARARTK
ncbi:MAG: glycoside hydrolase family 130 protein [Bdellovibrionota bacterium]